MKSRILILSLLAACYPSHARAAETNLFVETASSDPYAVPPLVVPHEDGTNLIFEIDPRGNPAYSPSNPVRDINLVGTGAWSEPVSDGHGNTLRGRLLVYWGRKTTNQPASHFVWGDAPTYVEIQDMTATNQHPTRIYFDLLHQLSFLLRDGKGAPADNLPKSSLRGGRPPSFWATLPTLGRLRLRADVGKGGSHGNDGELLLCFFSMDRGDTNFVPMGQIIPPGDTNDWFLSATLLPPPGNSTPPGKSTTYISNVWRGTLEFPAVKLSVVKRGFN